MFRFLVAHNVRRYIGIETTPLRMICIIRYETYAWFSLTLIVYFSMCFCDFHRRYFLIEDSF